MQMTKRLLAMFLCLVMLFTTVPVNAFATGEDVSDETVVTEAPEAETTGDTEILPTEDENPADVAGGGTSDEQTSDEAALPEAEASEDAELVSEEEADTDAAEAEPQADSGAVKVEHNGVTTYYADLQKAFDGFAPSNNSYGGKYVVTLLGDTTGVQKDLTYPTEVLDITLDLNGYTINGPSSASSTTVVYINFGSKNSTDCVFTIKDCIYMWERL